MSGNLLIRHGRIVDPTQALDQTADLVLAEGRVAAIGQFEPGAGDRVIDAGGCIVCPGLIDMHVHLREPGYEDKETIETGTAAAAAGGFTAVACMPNTNPPLDNDSQIEFVLRQAARSGQVRVWPIGALTRGRAGRELAEIGLMVRAGAVAFSDDGDAVADAGVCLRAMQYVAMFDKLFIQHCEEPSLAAGGCMHAGTTATRLGMPAIPALAEEIIILRDIALARQAGVRYHVAHISTAGAVELVRQAKRSGGRVSAEVCPHHLLLTDACCASFDPNFKMNPPLRSRSDVDACLEAVRDGTIDCLVTDHAPHTHAEKELGFQDAPFGIVGLETAVALWIKALIEPGVLDWSGFVQAASTRPAELLGIPGGSLRAGAPGDVTIIRPDHEWTIDARAFRSKGRNTPFDGWQVRGKAVATIVGGQIRYIDEAALPSVAEPTTAGT